jgi:hypothetical protein
MAASLGVSAVQGSEELVGELVRRSEGCSSVTVSCCCYKLVAEARG